VACLESGVCSQLQFEGKEFRFSVPQVLSTTGPRDTAQLDKGILIYRKNFSVNLPADAGMYYLVFDNKLSVLSQNEVEVKGALTYYQ
jgi:hypothetical protein